MARVAHDADVDRRPAIARPDDALLDRVSRAWEPYADGPLTRDDAAEINDNLCRFFEVLREWAIEDAFKGVGPWADRRELFEEE